MTERDNVDVWDKLSNTDVPYISIYSGGRIGIPKSTHVEYLDESTYVILKYSHDTEEIGIEPSEKSLNCFAINPSNRTISASEFLANYDLIPDETQRYPLSEFDGDTLWVDVGSDRAKI